MAVATHVIEYFARYPEYEILLGVYQPFELADTELLEQIAQLKSMLNAFSWIHEPRT